MFKHYGEAQVWMREQVRIHGSAFYSSDEYKDAYATIQRLHKEATTAIAQLAQKELSAAGVKVGDRVLYDYVSAFGTVTTYTGKIVMKGTVPYVNFDKGQKTRAGKKSVRWHKGFQKITAP